jgi:SH3-like domain-containing protein
LRPSGGIFAAASAGLFLLLLLCAPPAASAGDAVAVGSATRLPVPRFVSLKSDRVNLREGPSKDHRTTWIFQRAGLPVEITAEFETWRRIRDSEGTEGWVLHSLLSGRRTALAAPWMKSGLLPVRRKPEEDAAITAQLQPGVLATVRNCDAGWCRIAGDNFDGWIRQDRLWGVYPTEKID